MNPVLRKKLNILVSLAMADKDFAPQERDFITNICERNQLEPRVIDELMAHPDPIEGLGALSYEKSVEYMVDSIQLMLVDGQILPGEVIFCQDIAIRLGFSKLATDELIRQVSRTKTISRTLLEKNVRELPHLSKGAG